MSDIEEFTNKLTALLEEGEQKGINVAWSSGEYLKVWAYHTNTQFGIRYSFLKGMFVYEELAKEDV